MCPDANTKDVEAGSRNQRDTYGRGQGNAVGAADKIVGAHPQGPAGQREAATENQTLESEIKVTNKDHTYLRRVRAAVWFRASVAGESRWVLGASNTAASLSFAFHSPLPRSNSDFHFAINLKFHQSELKTGHLYSVGGRGDRTKPVRAWSREKERGDVDSFSVTLNCLQYKDK